MNDFSVSVEGDSNSAPTQAMKSTTNSKSTDNGLDVSIQVEPEDKNTTKTSLTGEERLGEILQSGSSTDQDAVHVTVDDSNSKSNQNEHGDDSFSVDVQDQLSNKLHEQKIQHFQQNQKAQKTTLSEDSNPGSSVSQHMSANKQFESNNLNENILQSSQERSPTASSVGQSTTRQSSPTSTSFASSTSPTTKPISYPTTSSDDKFNSEIGEINKLLSLTTPRPKDSASPSQTSTAFGPTSPTSSQDSNMFEKTTSSNKVLTNTSPTKSSTTTSSSMTSGQYQGSSVETDDISIQTPGGKEMIHKDVLKKNGPTPTSVLNKDSSTTKGPTNLFTVPDDGTKGPTKALTTSILSTSSSLTTPSSSSSSSSALPLEKLSSPLSPSPPSSSSSPLPPKKLLSPLSPSALSSSTTKPSSSPTKISSSSQFPINRDNKGNSNNYPTNFSGRQPTTKFASVNPGKSNQKVAPSISSSGKNMTNIENDQISQRTKNKPLRSPTKGAVQKVIVTSPSTKSSITNNKHGNEEEFVSISDSLDKQLDDGLKEADNHLTNVKTDTRTPQNKNTSTVDLTDNKSKQNSSNEDMMGELVDMLFPSKTVNNSKSASLETHKMKDKDPNKDLTRKGKF